MAETAAFSAAASSAVLLFARDFSSLSRLLALLWILGGEELQFEAFEFVRWVGDWRLRDLSAICDEASGAAAAKTAPGAK